MRFRDFASDDADSLSRVTTGDKSRIYSYEPKIKQQSSELKSLKTPSLKKTSQAKNNLKSMLIIFLDRGRDCSERIRPD
jgi:hypothetical protein